MAFVDEITISAKSGKGGDGVVRWLHLKGKEFSGPAGGNGGNGGSIYVRGIRDIGLLSRYRGDKVFKAQDGEPGGSRNMIGKSGADLAIDVPVGSIVRNLATGEEYEVLTENEPQLVLKGGRGGAGNAVFKSSVNRAPEESTPGGRGEEAELYIELRLIADAGFIGKPNAGKSSLLNALTSAQAKVGAYAFTTLDPNLGTLYGYTLADIPGIIEGASEGKGLGLKFLRHVARTRLLLHCVPLDSADPLADYLVVREELQSFEHGALAHKPEMIILTKADACNPARVDEVRALFHKKGTEVHTVSVIDDEALKKLSDAIVAALR